MTLRSHGRQQYTGLQTEQEGWTYYMEESTRTRSTGTVETNSTARGYYMEESTGTVETTSTDMSDSSTRGSPRQTGSPPPPPACLDHTYYSIQVLQDMLSTIDFHFMVLSNVSYFQMKPNCFHQPIIEKNRSKCLDI